MSRAPEGSLGPSAARFPESVAQSYRLQSDFTLTLLDSVADWVVVTDLGLRVVQANAPAARDLALGRFPAGKPALGACLSACDPADALELLGGGEGGKRALRCFTADAAGAKLRRLVSVSVLREEGKPYGYLFTGGAAVERGASDFALDLAARILDGVPYAGILFDHGSGAIVDCNAAFSEQFGRPRAEAVGSPLGDLACEDGEAFAAEVAGALRERGVHLTERDLLRADGSRCPCEAISISFSLDGGRKHLAVGILRDIGAERAREARMAGLLGELQGTVAAIAALRAAERPAPGGAGVESLSSLGATQRQVEIGALLMAGRSTKEISAELGLTESTVKNHLAALFKRLGVQTRLEFIKRATERHIIPG